jgi:hypothetical protein
MRSGGAEQRRAGVIVLALCVLGVMTVQAEPASEPGKEGAAMVTGNDLSKSALTALKLRDLPEVKRAREVIREFFFLPHAISNNPEVLSTVDQAVDETVFAALLAIAGSDPMNPQFAMYESLPYRTSGQQIPGSRYGFDNGDRAFRHFFVNPAFRYEIRGRRPPGTGSMNILIEACEDKPPGWGYPLSFVRLNQIDIDADGNFVITVDSTPTGDRRNHLWLPPGAAHVLIRDTYLDWSSQLPTELSVRRVSGPASPPAISFETMKMFAPYRVVEHALNTFKFWEWGVAPVQANTIPPPLVRPAPPGELPWGMTGVGRFHIADDEALVFTLDTVSAEYLGAMVTTPWLVGVDYANRTGTLNNFQAAKNPDGSMTYALAAHDPGIQNWLDTAGLHEGFMLFRWELLQRTPDPKLAVRDVRVVKLRDLQGALPFPTPKFSGEDRRKQVAERHEGYARRMKALLPDG